MTASVSLAASPDGAWLARRVGARLSLHATSRLGETRAIELETDDVDVTFAGPPDQLLVVVRAETATQVLLFNPPDLEIAARAEVEGKAVLGGVTGARLALITGAHRNLVLVRCAPRALVVQPVDAGPLIEDAVGLDDNRVLVVQAKKIEQWDAVMRRPMLRMNLPVPPAPRWIGAAKGAFWMARPGRPEVLIVRASDGRAFDHHVGGGVVAVGAHLQSGQIVLATETQLVRVHAFAHSTVALATRSAAALAQIVVGEDATLFGCDPDGALWRIALGDGTQVAAAAAPAPTSAKGGLVLDMAKAPVSKLAAAGPRTAPAPRADADARGAKPEARTAPRSDGARAWRAGVARWTVESIAHGERGERADGAEPSIPFDAALAALGDRLDPLARRALILLYGAWLHGRSRVGVLTLATALGGDDDAWNEALGTGALGARGWATVDGGALALVPAVARHCDGAAPRAVRLAGDPPARTAVHGLALACSDGGLRAIGAIGAIDGSGVAPHLETLASALGAIAVALPGAELADAQLEARLHDAVLVVPLAHATAGALASLAARGGDAIVLVEPADEASLPPALAALPSWNAPL